MKILLFLIALLVLFSCTKDKTPPKDECIEPYVGNYKVIEMRKADGTIIPEDKVRDSLQADHAWIERRELIQSSSPYDQIGWRYNFLWDVLIEGSRAGITAFRCDNVLALTGENYNSSKFPTTVEILPDTTIIITKSSGNYLVTNLKNSSQLILIKQ